MLVFPTLVIKSNNTAAEFIRFWSGVYDYPNLHLYTDNIDKAVLGERDLRALFEWKNGMILSGKKEAVFQKIAGQLPVINQLKASMDEIAFFFHFGTVGAIWQILLRHIMAPKQNPIFDQHVYRAYECLSTGYIGSELGSYGPAKLRLYEQYKEFFFQMGFEARDFSYRQIDQALWAFGKALKDNQPLLRQAGLSLQEQYLLCNNGPYAS